MIVHPISRNPKQKMALKIPEAPLPNKRRDRLKR
jgi:hypothetical protein